MRQGGASALLVAAAGLWLAAAAPAAAQSASVAARAADYRDLILAELALQAGDYAAAAERYEGLAGRAPGNADWANSAISAHLAAGAPDEALRLAEEAMAAGLSLRGDGQLTLAAAALRDRRWRQVPALLDGLASSGGSERLAAALLQVWTAAGRGRTQEALDDLARVPRARAIAATVPFQQAMLLEMAHRRTEAAEAYTEAIRGNRLLAEDLLSYGAFLQRTGQPEAAAAFFAERESSAMSVAVTAALYGDYQAPAPTPARGAAQGLIGLSRGLAAENAVVDATVIASLALLVDPAQDGARRALALLLDQQGQSTRAQAVLREIAPGSVYFEEAQIDLAQAQADAGDAAVGLVAVRSLAQSTESIPALWAWGELAFRAGSFDEAETAYGALIAAQARAGTPQWQPFYLRAITRDRLGRWSDAERDLLAALALSPSEPQVLNYLGYGWVDRGVRLEEGLQLIERALRGDPHAAYLLDSRGWALFRLGRFDEAVTALETAVVRAPSNVEILDHLGDALWRVGRTREARFQWARAQGLDPSEDARAARALKLTSGLPVAP